MFTDRIVANGKIAPTNMTSGMAVQYICRMSVPPVMMAQVAYEVYNSVEIGIPSIIAENFAIGNHLRGISSYLLKECGGKYDKYLVGKRLLNYTEIPLIDNNEDIKGNLPMIDKLEAIILFAQLLERQDDEALNRMMRILDILNEGRN